MRNVFAALALLLVSSPAQAAEIVAPSTLPVVQTVATLAAATDTVVGSSSGRRYLCLMNIGTGLVTLAFDQAAVAGAGWALEGTAVAGHQGGSMCWESTVVTASVVHAVSAAGTTLVVLEGH